MRNAQEARERGGRGAGRPDRQARPNTQIPSRGAPVIDGDENTSDGRERMWARLTRHGARRSWQSKVLASTRYVSTANSLTDVEKAIINDPQDVSRFGFTDLEQAFRNLSSYGRHSVVVQAIEGLCEAQKSSIPFSIMKIGMLSAAELKRPERMLSIFALGNPSKAVTEESLYTLIYGFERSDNVRDAVTLLSRWLEATKVAHVQGCSKDLEDFYNKYCFGLVRKVRYHHGTPPSIDTALKLRAEMNHRGCTTRLINYDTYIWDKVSPDTRIPMVVWTAVLRGYASRLAYGRAGRALDFLNALYFPSTSLTAATPYAKYIVKPSLMIDSIPDDATLFSMCQYFTLQSAMVADKSARDPLQQAVQLKRTQLDPLMQASLLAADHRADELIDLLRRETSDSRLLQEDGAYLAAELLRNSLTTLCASQNHSLAVELLGVLLGTSLPVDVLGPLKDVVLEKVGMSLLKAGQNKSALDLCAPLVNREEACSPTMYNVMTHIYSQDGRLDELVQLMQWFRSQRQEQQQQQQLQR